MGDRDNDDAQRVEVTDDGAWARTGPLGRWSVSVKNTGFVSFSVHDGGVSIDMSSGRPGAMDTICAEWDAIRSVLGRGPTRDELRRAIVKCTFVLAGTRQRSAFDDWADRIAPPRGEDPDEAARAVGGTGRP